MKLSNLLALEQHVLVVVYISACDGVCDGASSAIIQRRTRALIGKTPMLESGLQAAVSWASLLCVYIVAMAISELYAKYFFFFANEFPIGIYCWSSLEGQGPPMRTLGGRERGAIAPPAPPPLY